MCMPTNNKGNLLPRRFFFLPRWAGRRTQQRRRTSRIYRWSRLHCFWSCSTSHHWCWICRGPGPPPGPDLREHVNQRRSQEKHVRKLESEIELCTWEDEEDSRHEGQDGAMRPNMSDVAEDKTDEHEEEADQRKGRGWTDHLWGEEEVKQMYSSLSWRERNIGAAASLPLHRQPALN